MNLHELFRDPGRKTKPRQTGLTHVIDKGLSVAAMQGLVEVAGSYVDIVKFGWATGVVVENLLPKLKVLQDKGIDACCGGSLFELAVLRGKVNEYVAVLHDLGFKLVEISDGIVEMAHSEKLKHIEKLAKSFKVLSEVGKKDRRKKVLAPYRWVKLMKSELDAGAWKVIAEGRESGNVGLYFGDGSVRAGLIEEIIVHIDPSRLIFEAPLKGQQLWLIEQLGANVNLGNIAPDDVISLETLRQGLRADTMMAPAEQRLKGMFTPDAEEDD